MFKHFKDIDERLYERYLTVEKNIKSVSNSFYDSYLDLLEQFVRFVAVDFNVEVQVKESCGVILRKSEVENIFISKIGVDTYTYDKMKDYTLKVNSHKHKNEKNIQIDTILSYLTILYNATSCYAKYKGVLVDEFEVEYYIKIFGEYEKINKLLRDECATLKEELNVSINNNKMKEKDIEKFKKLIDISKLSKMSLEEQNKELVLQINQLKDIKISSIEEKLNKTIDLLNELTASVIENRAISYAVGDTICGANLFKKYIEKARKDIIKH